MLKIKRDKQVLKSTIKTLREAMIGVLKVNDLGDSYELILVDERGEKLDRGQVKEVERTVLGVQEITGETFTKEYIIEVIYKLDKFKKALNRVSNFTSCEYLDITVEEYEEGYYIIGGGTRTEVKQFVSRKGEYIRKPRNSKKIKEVEYYNGLER